MSAPELPPGITVSSPKAKVWSPLISSLAPAEPETLPGFEVKITNKLGPEEVKLVKSLGLRTAVLNPELAKLTMGYNLRLTQKSGMLGGMLVETPTGMPASMLVETPTGMPASMLVGMLISIPHRIRIRHPETTDSVIIATTLTTHFHLKVEAVKASKLLVDSIIHCSFKSGIRTGYHYLRQPTQNGVEVKTWYRPLDIKAAAACDYQVPVPNLPSVDDYHQVARIMYAVTAPAPHRGTKLADFEHLVSGLISLAHPTASEFKRLNSVLNWVTVLDSKTKIPIVIGCWRPFTIYGSSSPAKAKLIPAAQLVYVEVLGPSSTANLATGLNTIFSIIKSAGYIVVHGVELGGLSQVADQLRLIRTPNKMYLNFYNLTLAPELESRDINLLYI